MSFYKYATKQEYDTFNARISELVKKDLTLGETNGGNISNNFNRLNITYDKNKSIILNDYWAGSYFTGNYNNIDFIIIKHRAPSGLCFPSICLYLKADDFASKAALIRYYREIKQILLA